MITFGSYNFRTNTPYIGPLRHSLQRPDSAWNLIQLEYWKESLTTHDYNVCLTDPQFEAKYKQYNANRTASLAKIESLKDTAAGAQIRHDECDAKLDASFALMGRDTEARNPVRLSTEQTTMVEKQREHYAHNLDQSRSRIKNLQEQIKFEDHEHTEITKLVKQALIILRAMFNTSTSGITTFSATIENTLVTVEECLSQERTYTLWRLIELYIARHKSTAVEFIRSHKLVFEDFPKFEEEFQQLLTMRNKFSIGTDDETKFDMFKNALPQLLIDKYHSDRELAQLEALRPGAPAGRSDASQNSLPYLIEYARVHSRTAGVHANTTMTGGGGAVGCSHCINGNNFGVPAAAQYAAERTRDCAHQSSKCWFDPAFTGWRSPAWVAAHPDWMAANPNIGQRPGFGAGRNGGGAGGAGRANSGGGGGGGGGGGARGNGHGARGRQQYQTPAQRLAAATCKVCLASSHASADCRRLTALGITPAKIPAAIESFWKQNQEMAAAGILSPVRKGSGEAVSCYILNTSAPSPSLRLFDLGANANVTRSCFVSNIRELQHRVKLRGIGPKEMWLTHSGTIAPFPQHPSLQLGTYVCDAITFNILAPITLLQDQKIREEWGVGLHVPHADSMAQRLILSATKKDGLILLDLPVGKHVSGLFVDEIPSITKFSCTAEAHAKLNDRVKVTPASCNALIAAMQPARTLSTNDTTDSCPLPDHGQPLTDDTKQSITCEQEEEEDNPCAKGETKASEEDNPLFYQLLSLAAACEAPTASDEDFNNLTALCMDVFAFANDIDDEEDIDEDLPESIIDDDPVTAPLKPEQRRCQDFFYEAHERLGHASVKVMKLIRKYKSINGIEWNKIKFPDSEWKCDFCLRAKMARRPFLRKAPLRAQATRVAQKLSGDLLGKYNFSDVVMDLLHYLTVVCHYSSYLWVRPLDSKAQTFEELASLLRMLEKKYGGVESFRSDNENSIDSEALQKVLHDLAIESDICGIGSAAANGEIERKHRDIGDRTRVELLQSGETPAVLPYVMLHAARMMNCMPRSDGRIPWVLVHGCPVLWELMRQFAHACVVRVVDPGNKLQPRAVRGRFFGMSVDSTTVALIKVQTKTSSGRIAWRVIPSRDFHFLPDPMLPAGTFIWDYVSDHWLPEYDTQGRELFTNKHHECVCAGCKAGGQGLLECDYCELVWHRKCAGVPTGKKIDKLVWRCPACRKNDESVTPIVSKEQRHAAARARNDALAQRRKEEANRVQTKRAVTRAQRNLRRQEHANAAVHALSMQIAYSKHASEAAATKITERYAAEASLKIAAAKETRCLPKGVQQITPAYYAANQTSKRAAGPSEAEMAHFINAADIHADEKHVHLTHLHAGTPYADDAECFDGWLRHLNENGMDVPIGLDGGVYVEMCKADLAAFGELTMDQVPWPKDFEEAKASPYYLSWKDAMRAEVHENLKIGVGLIPKTEADAAGQKLLGTKWVFTTKEKNGHVVFKARLTVRGDQQDPASINNDHRASPTTDSDMIRLILAQLANVPGARFLTFDFVRAYLQAKLPSDYKPVYIRRPQGLHSEFPDGTIFLLGVNMYGLVTAAYLWYKELCSGMERLGWTRGDTDVCMWRKDTPAGPVFVAVHVDDGLLAGFAVDGDSGTRTGDRTR